jgi:hypothetical protein
MAARSPIISGFGAHVLVRALVERAAILLYLHLYPEEIDRCNRSVRPGRASGW